MLSPVCHLRVEGGGAREVNGGLKVEVLRKQERFVECHPPSAVCMWRQRGERGGGWSVVVWRVKEDWITEGWRWRWREGARGKTAREV